MVLFTVLWYDSASAMTAREGFSSGGKKCGHKTGRQKLFQYDSGSSFSSPSLLLPFVQQ
jgi:hypothetical protein